MGIFDLFTGTKRPQAGTPTIPVGELKAKLLALNRPTAPYQIVDGSQEKVDLIAEWKIVDVKWYEIFAKAGLQEIFRIYLKLHPESFEVRALDKKYSVSWTAGLPSLSVSASMTMGQQTEVSFGSAYAFTEKLEYGQVYNYRFNTQELKSPLQKIITEGGWTYKGVFVPNGL